MGKFSLIASLLLIFAGWLASTFYLLVLGHWMGAIVWASVTGTGFVYFVEILWPGGIHGQPSKGDQEHE